MPANRLRELRQSHTPRPTMRELANLVGRDTSTYFRYETGQLDLSTEQLRTLAGFYDVSVEHLLGWDRDEVAA